MYECMYVMSMYVFLYYFNVVESKKKVVISLKLTKIGNFLKINEDWF